MKTILALLLLPSLALAGPVDERFRIMSTVPGSFNGQDIVDLDDIYSTCMTSDAAPTPTTVIASKCVFPGVAAVNTTGGNTCLIPAPGNVQITGVTRAATTGDTITFVTIDSSCATATTVITEGDGTLGTYDCDGAISDAVCVANLAATIAANATLGPLVNVVYPAATETLHFGIKPGASMWFSATASDAANTVITTGSAGQILVPQSASAATSVIAAVTGTTTGIGIYPGGWITFNVSGTTLGTVDTSGFTTPATGRYAFNGRSNLYSPANGYLKNASATTGASAYQTVVQTITCTDDGAATHSTAGCTGIVIASNVVQLVCEDAHGCTPTFAETNWAASTSGVVTLIGPPANHADIADSADVIELAGGAAMAMNALDTLTLVYGPSTWLEVGRAVN